MSPEGEEGVRTGTGTGPRGEGRGARAGWGSGWGRGRDDEEGEDDEEDEDGEEGEKADEDEDEDCDWGQHRAASGINQDVGGRGTDNADNRAQNRVPKTAAHMSQRHGNR